MDNKIILLLKAALKRVEYLEEVFNKQNKTHNKYRGIKRDLDSIIKRLEVK